MNTIKITSRTQAKKAASLERQAWRRPFTGGSIEEGLLLLQQAARYWQEASERVSGHSPNREYFEARKEYCLHDRTESVLKSRFAQAESRK